MPLPDYELLMFPLLKFASDGQEHTIRNATEVLSEEFNLTDEEKKALLPSGAQTIIANRVGWAKTYLKKADLLESKRRGYFSITQRGLDALKEKTTRIDNNYLLQFPEFREFKNKKSVQKKKCK